ncbi:cysteine-rich and transmembrane domain-containing protein 1-like [Actinia tenebrosa]|uniref:Cysteine-rich and transmembrane domain-containing protein 1-like n=1 Tax=Actinia tenebrosa TaxID=6105 RepID=A0A6P8IA39_ACTTE|nr:cysteine-rich and transmembrane domain-containing protein 1-like [Actinia tenebrosa]
MSYQQPYNPAYPPPGPYPPSGPYQQGPPPPGFNPPPPQYSPYPQQQYGPQYGPPHQGGTTVYTQQPDTVYVYEDQRRRRDTSGEECFLWGLCAACLCCCLLND